MAVRYAVATGNWSNTATWNGGTLPTSSDDVYANTFTVTIDQNVTVLSLRTTANASPTVTAGGLFTFGDGVTITANGTGVVAGSSYCVRYTGTSSSTLNANVAGSATTANIFGLQHSGTGALTVYGDVGTFAATAAGGTGAIISSTGTLNVIGNIRSSTTNNGGGGINTTTACVINITGNVVGQGGNGTTGIVSSGNAVITVTGSVTGTGNSAHGITHTGASGSVTIVGNVYAPSVSQGGSGLFIGGVACTFSVTGDAVGSTYGQHAIQNTGNSATKINTFIGTAYAGLALSTLGGAAISDSNNAGGWTAVGGSLIDSDKGDSALYVRRLRVIPTLNTVRQHANNTGYPSGGTITYGSLDYIPNNVPVPTDVRSGTVYGNNSFTGTCAVPAAASVAYGVPVDDTVGTAAVNLEDVASITGAQIAAALKYAQ